MIKGSKSNNASDMKTFKVDSDRVTLKDEMIGHVPVTLTLLRGTETNRVTAHIPEVQAHRRIHGVHGLQQVLGGQQLLLNGEQAEENVRHQRILIRKLYLKEMHIYG